MCNKIYRKSFSILFYYNNYSFLIIKYITIVYFQIYIYKDNTLDYFNCDFYNKINQAFL